jgi:hypothetical protein
LFHGWFLPAGVVNDFWQDVFVVESHELCFRRGSTFQSRLALALPLSAK